MPAGQNPSACHRQAAVAVVLACLGFLVISAASFAPVWERAFRSDGSPVSWLSSALLLALAAMALRLMADGGLPRGLGVWMASSMLLLALDEQFMWHEVWKYRCHEWLEACRWQTVRELPMLAVGAVGLVTLVALRRALPGAFSRRLLMAGLATGLWAILVDQWPMPYPIAELEEAFEVLAECLVLAAFVSVAPR